MDETSASAPRGRRPSGRDAKRAARTARAHNFVPYITRKIPYYEVLGNDGLELLEHRWLEPDRRLSSRAKRGIYGPCRVPSHAE